MTDLLRAQYALVQSARRVLLDYCATLAPAHLLAPVPAFNHSSIRDLLVHVANTYYHWLGVVARGLPTSYIDPADVPDVATLRAGFARADELVTELLTRTTGHEQPTPLAVPGRAAPVLLTPLQLFTHVVTHEFHHKGQVLSMSRQLGYVPVDTDVIRT